MTGLCLKKLNKKILKTLIFLQKSPFVAYNYIIRRCHSAKVTIEFKNCIYVKGDYYLCCEYFSLFPRRAFLFSLSQNIICVRTLLI